MSNTDERKILWQLLMNYLMMILINQVQEFLLDIKEYRYHHLMNVVNDQQ